MDAFYVAVEVRRDPSLRGKPVVVGGAGARGVIASASYEARAFGVRSAMPSLRAQRLCPQAVFLRGDHALYGELSAQVHEIFHRFTPLVEPIALDEAFLDVSAARRLFGTGPELAMQLRQTVADELSLTCSVGVAPSKLLAKLASEAAKPRPSRRGPIPGRGVVVVEPGDELRFLHAHPVEALWGVGPATLARIARLGVRTVGDLAAVPEETLVAMLGNAHGGHLYRLAHAIDDREVVADREPKSIGHEETFGADLFEPEAVHQEMLRLADSVGSRLRRHGYAGRTITVKVRFGDFRTITRSLTLKAAVEDGSSIARAAAELLAAIDPSPGVRLLGVSASGLVPAGSEPAQLSFAALDEPAATNRWQPASRAMDDIRERFGRDAITPATLVSRPAERPDMSRQDRH